MGRTMRKRQRKKGKRARQRQRDCRRVLEVGLERESVCVRERGLGGPVCRWCTHKVNHFKINDFKKLKQIKVHFVLF